MDPKLYLGTLEYQQGYNDCLNGRLLDEARDTFDETHWELYRTGFMAAQELRDLWEEENKRAARQHI